jgi:hypothetical protein
MYRQALLAGHTSEEIVSDLFLLLLDLLLEQYEGL